VFGKDILERKVAFVTGGGSGIGYSIAEHLMKHGADVIIASRDLSRLTNAAAELEKSTGKKCKPLQLDVRNAEQVDKVVEEAVRTFGKIDILINSAAGNFLCSAEDLTYNGFKTVLNIDAFGTFAVSRAVFLKSMKKNGGCIINITATLHWNGELFQVHAGAAKAAIEAMARHLGNEWGRYGIRVNNIAPGPIQNTLGFDKLGGALPAADLKEFSDSIPLRRFGYPHEIAQTALFLVSDAASYITGATLLVDGGAWMTTGGFASTSRQQLAQKASKL